MTYSTFNIELGRADGLTIPCEFALRDTELAQQWAREIAKGYELFERERFTNWPNDNKDNYYYATEINKCIDVVVETYPGTISSRANLDMEQDTLNSLHVFFEQLRGPVLDPSAWFIAAPSHVQAAIERFNVLIHEYEHVQFNRQWQPITQHPYATIVGTYNDRPRYGLADEHYDLYTYKWTFGTVYINYCEVGKPLLDVFKDQDEHIGPDNIRPLHYWSADWMIKFGPSTLPEVYEHREKLFWDWFARKENFFNDLGIRRGPKLALGLIPVADIKLESFGEMTPIEIVELYAPYRYLVRTWVD